MSTANRLTASVLCAAILLGALFLAPTASAEENGDNEPSKLLVLWTSGDREVALKMVFMYTLNAKKNGWWETIRFIIWGPSSKLLSEDHELQQELKKMKEAGVEIIACKACADLYGIAERLEALGLTVKYVGRDLTDMLKEGWISLTF